MKKSLFLALLFVLSAVLAVAQSAGNDQLTVKISGLRSTNGKVRIDLFNSSQGFPKDESSALQAVWVDASQTQQGTIQTTFKDLPSGDYAVLSFHDENGTGPLDRGAFGKPKEGYLLMSLKPRPACRPIGL